MTQKLTWRCQGIRELVKMFSFKPLLQTQIPGTSSFLWFFFLRTAHLCLEEIYWWDNWDGKLDPYEASWNNNREFMNSFLRRVMQVNIRASCVLRRARKQGPYCHRSSPTRSLLYQSTHWPAVWLINTLVLSVKQLMCDQQLPQQGIGTPQFPHVPCLEQWSS